MKLGAARDQSRSAWRLVVIEMAADSATFSYRLDRHKLRQTRSREGRYLLRTNLVEEDPAKLWSHYLAAGCGRGGIQEPQKPAPAKAGDDLAIRPVFHQLEARVEAHVLIAFLAYCLHVTLARRLHALAPGLTSRSVVLCYCGCFVGFVGDFFVFLPMLSTPCSTHHVFLAIAENHCQNRQNSLPF